MNDGFSIESAIMHHATAVIEQLDADSKKHNLCRANLVDLFCDTLQALEQWKIQED